MVNEGTGGFYAQSIFALLYFLALLLGTFVASAGVLRRVRRRVPPYLWYVPIPALSGVVGLSALGVAVLYVTAPSVSLFVILTVLLPLAVVGAYLRHTTALARPDVLTVTAMAWSGPFLVGQVVIAIVHVVFDVVAEFDPAAVGWAGINWIAVPAGVLAMVGGGVYLGRRIAQWAPEDEPQ